MDLTPLRPNARFLSSKIRIGRLVSRFKARLSAWIVAGTLVLAEGDPERIASPSHPRIYVFPFLRYTLHNPFVVALHAKPAGNLRTAHSCDFAAQIWSGRPSATHPRTCQSLLSMMLLDFALWPSFCPGSRQSKAAPVTGAYREIGFRKGGLWVIPQIQSVC